MLKKPKSFAGLIILLLFTLVLCGINLSCAAVPSSSGNTAACEQALFDAVNELRQNNKTAPLSRNAFMDDLCRKHAQYMASQGRNSHDNLDLRISSIRKNVSGMASLNENVMSSSYLPCDGPHMASAWFRSPEHQTIMLNAVFTISGMGIAISKSGQIWVCQMFAGP